MPDWRPCVKLVGWPDDTNNVRPTIMDNGTLLVAVLKFNQTSGRKELAIGFSFIEMNRLFDSRILSLWPRKSIDESLEGIYDDHIPSFKYHDL